MGAEDDAAKRSARRRLAVGGPVFLWLALSYAHQTIDDSFIVAGYARGLVERGELSWFGVRTEGFSDLLWVFVQAGALVAGVDPIAAAKGVSLLCGLALLGLVARWLPPRPEGDLVFAALVGWVPLAHWSAMGLETMAFTLAVVTGWGGLVRGRPGLVAWLGVAALIRFEGIGWLLLGAAFVLWRHRSRRDRLPVALAVLVLAAVHVARVQYFGRALPNAMVLKASLGWFWIPQLAEEALAAAGLLLAVAGSTRLDPRARLVTLLPVALSLVTFVGMGGDWMGRGRMLAPGAVASVVAWMHLGSRRRQPARWWWGVAALASLVEPRFLEAPRLRALVPRLGGGLDTPLRGPLAYLVEQAPPGAVVQAADIGVVAHIPGLTVVDSRGLTSPFFLDVRQNQDWERLRAWYAETPPDLIVVSRFLPEDILALGMALEPPEGLDPWLRPVDDLLAAYPFVDELAYREGTWRGAIRVHRRERGPVPLAVQAERWRELATVFPCQPFFRERHDATRRALAAASSRPER